MAQFKSMITGRNGGVVERYGTKGSHPRVILNGWNSGIQVEACYNYATGLDEFHIYSTGGTSGVSEMIVIGILTEESFEAFTKEG